MALFKKKSISSENKDLIPKHHTNNGFCNSDPVLIDPKSFTKWRKTRKVFPPKGGYIKFNQDWYQKANFSLPASNHVIWWLGHSTALIKMNDKTILTDPVFFDRVSPISFIGPKRKTPCAALIDDLPKIDIIVISHNHYDHLDYPSVKALIKKFPSVRIMGPLGLKKQIISWGAKYVIELDWWQNTVIDGLKLTSIPARHWSRRKIYDTNQTLWCGWMIEYENKSIYFLGDTSYTSEFTLVKQYFPNIDVALIPIACYSPRWFMSNQHVDPAEAIQIFNDIGCKHAIAIHWGSFELADEPLDEPPHLLAELLKQNKISKENFLILKIGENYEFKLEE